MDTPRAGERGEQRARTLSDLLVNLVVVIVYTLAGVTVLAQLDISIGPLLAGAGVIGLAVGFGAQQLVKDVISGFFILAEDQFGVGD
ncbi:MAG: mechanosensitive ion channel family protein, partial [Frankia sp.]|nr:mechanosensitive ion channel family protein [Frankia sp.]